MSIDKATVIRIAALARIKVPEAEQERLAGELQGILAWVEQLNELDTADVEPMTHAVEVTMPQRADVVTDGNRVDRILANRVAYQESFRDEMRELTPILTPAQRGQFLLIRDRFLQQVHELQQQRAGGMRQPPP